MMDVRTVPLCTINKLLQNSLTTIRPQQLNLYKLSINAVRSSATINLKEKRQLVKIY